MKMDINKKMAITNNAIPILHGFVSAPIFTLLNDKKLKSMEREVVDFIAAHHEVIFTHADKGNVTVAMDRDDYIRRMNLVFEDRETYTVLNKDPIKKLTTSLRNLLTGWRNNEYINYSEYRTLYCSDGVLPRAYGLPKIHKTGFPLRIIVSSIGSPLHALASFLHSVMFQSIPKADSYIKNSFQLIEKLRNVNMEDKYELVSLDVISLFTNVPLEMAIDCINEQWCFISGACSLPKKEFLDSIHLVLNSTYFLFDKKIYKQCFGTPMGSPLSPIVADLVMRRLESLALLSFNRELPFYYRYVDDVCLAVDVSDINLLLRNFNEFHPRLQFTVEIGGDRLEFLDVSMIKRDNRLIFDWFHKPTFS
ncbi:PREDICTED: uncharacterized protein LOC108782002, partial [Cyphomyrmex costatus]|uniref:uncharacterized protein LOC108782002 n=1 Tax=Cyphomyrmex costatus TaxID=456900 RepID=UPI00085230EC